jgi:chemotaxis protein MotB
MVAIAPALAEERAQGSSELLLQMLNESRVRIERLSEQAAALAAEVERVRGALDESLADNRRQAQRIEELEEQLRNIPPSDPLAAPREAFFAYLNERLPASVLYEVRPDRLIIAADPVFVFGKGIIGAEGAERLLPVVAVLTEALTGLPESEEWRLRIEGHTDPRPLRRNRYFPTNWELSAARAVAMLRYLEAQGVPDSRLSAVALAATRPLTPEDSAAAHRLNRRLEIHLVSR